MQIFVHRLILTFEQRLNDNWNLKASDLMSESWETIEALLIEKVKETLQRRSERVLGGDGEIARDLHTNLDLLETAVDDPDALMRLLVMMTQGKVITFDERTHRRKMKATRRLTYIFLAARQLEGQPLAQVQADILDHLERAQDKLALVWGGAELNRLHKAGHTLGDLTKDWHQRLIDQLGDPIFSRVKDQPLNQLNPEDHQAVLAALGRFAQNRLYRQLLLSKISELWVEYLTRVEALRVSVRMEAYGQKDPLVAYKGGASEMFSGLLSDIRAGVINQMFRVRLFSGEDLKKLQSAANPPRAESSNGGRKPQRKKSRKRH
jgi:preprotein translocase subunit SecA